MNNSPHVVQFVFDYDLKVVMVYNTSVMSHASEFALFIIRKCNVLFTMSLKPLSDVSFETYDLVQIKKQF